MPRFPKFTVRGFRRPQDALADALGDLERQVMDVLWGKEGSPLRPLTVRDVRERLAGTYAYTTVMTTMDRLFQKRLLARTSGGRAYHYAARLTRPQFDGALATQVIHGLLKDARPNSQAAGPVLACIVDAVSDYDVGLLDELEQLIHAARHAQSHVDQTTGRPTDRSAPAEGSE